MNSTAQICYATKLLSGTFRKKFTKADVIKRLMKEQKATFGALLETKREKLKRLNLEKKGRIAPASASLFGNSELSWVLRTSVNRQRLVRFSPNHDLTTGTVTLTGSALAQSKRKEVFSKVQTRIIRKTSVPNIRKSKSKSAGTTENVLPEPKTDKQNSVRETSQSKTVDPPKSSLIIMKEDPKDTETQMQGKQTDSILLPPVDIIKNINEASQLCFKELKKLNLGRSSEIISISPVEDEKYFAFPSVTRILNATMSETTKKMLELWMARMIQQMGQEGFDVYKRGLLQNGKLLHSAIDGTLRKLPVEVPDNLRSCYDSVKIVLDEVEDVRVIESQVVHQNLGYRGVVDCVATYRGNLCLIDWKKSDKKKQLLRATYDAPLQIASYVGALNADKNYPFEITSGLLVIAYTLGDPPTVFTLSGEMLQHYWKQWLARLKKYYTGKIPSENHC